MQSWTLTVILLMYLVCSLLMWFLDGHFPHAVQAPFNCKEQKPCLEGTRTDVLNQICQWIGVEGLDLYSDGKSKLLPGINTTVGQCLLWINGSAGTGKTTIAYTIAAACSNFGVLGASFFCSRDDAECSNPKLIFSTIAHQLAQFCPSFEVELMHVLKLHPDIAYSNVSYQLKELIVKPLQAAGELFPPCVVVIDALDECKDSNSVSIVLSAIACHVDGLSPLKILVTSRPEQRISTAFKMHPLHPVTQQLILHEVELTVVQQDIEQYLTSKLTLLRTIYKLENSWPSAKDIQALALLSYGLFIFAATSVKFIEDQNYSDPKAQLATLLSHSSAAISNTSSPHHHLDQLYTEVLMSAFPDISSSLLGRLKMILGSLILLQDQLSPHALEQLLFLRSGIVQETLAHLHSVIVVPDSDKEVIRLLHPSFFDFMTTADRCLNSKFVVNPQAQHTLLAHRCLETMKQFLQRDICKIKNFSLFNNEVPDLANQIITHIPTHLQYACCHWAAHLENSMVSDSLLNLIHEFCNTQLLHWIEACSLLGQLQSVLSALDVTKKVLAVSQCFFNIVTKY
jgi:NACHT domain